MNGIHYATAGTWGLKLIAAVILLQTLFYKFSAAPESVYIFSAVGMEPWGRISTGVLELVASLLILIPATTVYGALLASGLMLGAVFFHLTKLGIVVQNDGGRLFVSALLVLLSSAVLVLIKRAELLEAFRHATKNAA